eukprot:TRINITY_DN7523_c0_g1_i3.p1 TRINITY_DN7523_c0_g1~~TRINITY_DN7523_c0_g1_i3.p1  ORF type:complete len:496 (-),score=132.46 TRINITY_DN7523_c0_g1_i3:109-1596(-)
MCIRDRVSTQSTWDTHNLIRSNKTPYLKVMSRPNALLAIAIFCIISTHALELEILKTEFDHHGKIDEICADVATIKRTNSRILDTLDNISNTLFFKIFRVNLENECPFWAQKLICTQPGKCSVCKCEDPEIPVSWKTEDKKSKVDQSPLQDLLAPWSSLPHEKKDEEGGNFIWYVEDPENAAGVYVNLKLNPEAFTGYQGQKIWSAIYSENCFKGDVSNMCLEERTLNRMISGLHTSISTQLSEYYIDFEYNVTKPNLWMFFEKVGNYPERILNLYFVYSVMLRALNRAGDYLKKYEYDTGDFQNDIQTRNLMADMINITMADCDVPFQEKELFQDVTKRTIRDQFMQYFYNISRIMDCVECEKCRVYGKMQTYGLGAALKILLNDEAKHRSFSLERNEIIALVNTFIKFATSIEFVDRMFERRRAWYMNCALACGVGITAFVIFVILAIKFNKAMQTKIKKQYKFLKHIKDEQSADLSECSIQFIIERKPQIYC